MGGDLDEIHGENMESKISLHNSLSTTKVVLIGVWLVYRCAPDAVTVIEWVQLPYYTPMSITKELSWKRARVGLCGEFAKLLIR